MSQWSVERETELIKQFDSLFSRLDEWGSLLDNKILEVLRAESGFDPYHIKIAPSHRVKDKTSFIRKAFYRGKTYNDPLLQIEDKVGTRVVVLTTDQIYQVRDILMKYDDLWECKIGKDIHESHEELPKQFDYQAVHLTVKPKRIALNYDADVLDLLTCEVQIKTLFQHACAEVSHDTVYKGPFRHETTLVRNLSKVIAFMEAADDYFCDMMNMVTSNDLYTHNLMKELTGMHRDLSKGAPETAVDSYLVDSVIGMLNKIGPLDPQNIRDFIIQHSDDIEYLLRDRNFYLANQPVVLLLAYMVNKHPHLLAREWMLSKDILSKLFQKMGTGLDD